MKKIKAVLPSLREKKRYLAFEIISKEKIKGFKQVRDAITQGVDDYLGAQGSSLAGVIVLKERYDENKQKGLIKVNNRHTDMLKASFCFIDKVDGKKAIIRSLGISGTLRTAYEKYIAS